MQPFLLSTLLSLTLSYFALKGNMSVCCHVTNESAPWTKEHWFPIPFQGKFNTDDLLQSGARTKQQRRFYSFYPLKNINPAITNRESNEPERCQRCFTLDSCRLWYDSGPAFFQGVADSGRKRQHPADNLWVHSDWPAKPSGRKWNHCASQNDLDFRLWWRRVMISPGHRKRTCQEDLRNPRPDVFSLRHLWEPNT